MLTSRLHLMNFCEWVQNSFTVSISPLCPTSSASTPNVSMCSPFHKYCHFWGQGWFDVLGLMGPVLWEVLGLWESPGIPFCSRKCCFIPRNTYRSRSWLNGGDFKQLIAFTGGWSISFLLALSFRLCCFTDMGEQSTLSTLTHWKAEKPWKRS